MATTSKNGMEESLNQLFDVISMKPWFVSIGSADGKIYVYVRQVKDTYIGLLRKQGFNGYPVQIVRSGSIRTARRG